MRSQINDEGGAKVSTLKHPKSSVAICRVRIKLPLCVLGTVLGCFVPDDPNDTVRRK